MFSYLIRRSIIMIPTLILISLIGFIIIELPEGDYLTRRISELQRQGHTDAREQMEVLRTRYGLDKPFYERYLIWITGFIRGDFGLSFEYNRPVSELIGQRLGLTIVVSLSTLIFTWVIALPIGIYSATHQYTLTDHFFTFIGFLGLSIPNFLFALVLLVIGIQVFGYAPTGLFSDTYRNAPWSFAKVLNMLKHLWVPVIVIGTAGTASLIRIMRGNLLDILGEQYIQTARSKGLKESIVIYKHAVRNAIHPLIMQLGMTLPQIISGAAITGIVLGLPTTGPMYLTALENQDMYLAGTFLVFLALLLLLGNFLSDILLALVDPRIRYS
ncbi:MAG: ABC transporter permease [Halanaerobiaceae bacterium]